MELIFQFIAAYFRFSLIVALLPALFLMFLIYRQDRVEREPVGLLFKLFLLGALVTFPAGWLERLAVSFLRTVYPNAYSTLFLFIENFLIVGLIEEGGKYLVLRTTWRHPAFNYRFDAVVYGAFSALGFAAAENLLYVFRMGIGVAPVRAVTAIPLHCICGIFMGHFYGLAKSCERHALRGRAAQYHTIALLLPMLIHGFYDFSVTSGYEVLQTVFLVFVVALDIIAIISVRKYARQDVRV
ncbi:MAG: PrsW family intramembrane metalloprotease [Lachnospiraceae bacterium]|nr:PrsW family intramembrane metalloprotease [Lachnospiraceae bacterium]